MNTVPSKRHRAPAQKTSKKIKVSQTADLKAVVDIVQERLSQTKTAEDMHKLLTQQVKDTASGESFAVHTNALLETLIKHRPHIQIGYRKRVEQLAAVIAVDECRKRSIAVHELAFHDKYFSWEPEDCLTRFADLITESEGIDPAALKKYMKLDIVMVRMIGLALRDGTGPVVSKKDKKAALEAKIRAFCEQDLGARQAGVRDIASMKKPRKATNAGSDLSSCYSALKLPISRRQAAAEDLFQSAKIAVEIRAAQEVHFSLSTFFDTDDDVLLEKNVLKELYFQACRQRGIDAPKWTGICAAVLSKRGFETTSRHQNDSRGKKSTDYVFAAPRGSMKPVVQELQEKLEALFGGKVQITKLA